MNVDNSYRSLKDFQLQQPAKSADTKRVDNSYWSLEEFQLIAILPYVAEIRCGQLLLES